MRKGAPNYLQTDYCKVNTPLSLDHSLETKRRFLVTEASHDRRDVGGYVNILIIQLQNVLSGLSSQNSL